MRPCGKERKTILLHILEKHLQPETTVFRPPSNPALSSCHLAVPTLTPWIKPDGTGRDMSRKCWKGDLGLWQLVWSSFLCEISGGSCFAISQECLILLIPLLSLSGEVMEACDIPGGHCLTKLAWDNFGLSSKQENTRERISLKAED